VIRAIPKQLHYFGAGFPDLLLKIFGQYVLRREDPDVAVTDVQADALILKMPQEAIDRGSHEKTPPIASI
jgi:hypothetical protein